jgi:hypothetical protein
VGEKGNAASLNRNPQHAAGQITAPQHTGMQSTPPEAQRGPLSAAGATPPPPQPPASPAGNRHAQDLPGFLGVAKDDDDGDGDNA